MERTIMLRGPFTDEHIRRVCELMHSIDAEVNNNKHGDAPDELFEVVVDDPRTDSHIDNILSQIPVRPGYERIVRFIQKNDRR